jgi:hypothetical protein
LIERHAAHLKRADEISMTTAMIILLFLVVRGYARRDAASVAAA